MAFAQQESESQSANNSDALKQMSLIRNPPGIEAQLYAAEPDVKNPVAIFVDFRGRLFVCESFRQEKGIEDNRNHQHWLVDDLAAQTVDDRLAYIKKHLGDKANDYTKNDDRIRLLVDQNDDGSADRSTIFSDGYNQIVSGTGAGVLSYRGNVYFTCIPDLWRLNDDDSDGICDRRAVMHTGFGVRFAFRGHDMHGLIIGPDGRLYFSIGDRGYNVKTESAELVNPESGAVFRCELDGSNLEVVHSGLRNPQELAFDNYGNLFTGDNNSDSGDKARWVYVVPGGDSGWRMAYQYLPDRGPFNREKIWHPFSSETPAYVVPPIANIADGPSGLTYYPGTGFGDRFDNCFLLCDFRGQSSNSGIRSFRLKNVGASFEVTDMERPFWHVLATDADFGPDGKLYVSDWVHGWIGEEKGRIYTFSDPSQANSDIVAEVQSILKTDMAQRSDLYELLAHIDKRVRQEAQFELVRRRSVDTFQKAALDSTNEMRRLHAIWGLSQLARADQLDNAIAESIASQLIIDIDPEVQYQAMHLVADAKLRSQSSVVSELVNSQNARVQYGAALCLGRLQATQHAPQIFKMLEANADRDPMLRHAGIMALTWIKDDQSLQNAITHPSVSVRLAGVVAMRKLGDSRVSVALNDADPLVVLEAGRAIHDLPIPSQLPYLAAMANSVVGPDPLLRRVMNANFTLGRLEHAKAIMNIAINPDIEADRRIDALRMLEDWNDPSPLDRVLNMYRPITDRPQIDIASVFKNALPALLAGSESVSTEALRVAAQLKIKDVQPLLSEVLFDVNRSERSRSAALEALIKLESNQSKQFVLMGLESQSQLIKQSALSLAPQVIPEQALPYIDAALESASIAFQQTAIEALGQLNDPAANARLIQLGEKLVQNELPAELKLDVWQQIEANKDECAVVYHKLIASENGEVESTFRYSNAGGNGERGKQIFLQRAAVSCLRCHKIDGHGGEVGPDLSNIGSLKDRQYLLNSIVLPNKDIAENFETVIVLDADGRTHTGILKEQTEDHVVLITAEGNRVTIGQDDIDDISNTKSSMPENLIKHLSASDVRDLVEFLANLKQTAGQ